MEAAIEPFAATVKAALMAVEAVSDPLAITVGNFKAMEATFDPFAATGEVKLMAFTATTAKIDQVKAPSSAAVVPSLVIASSTTMAERIIVRHPFPSISTSGYPCP